MSPLKERESGCIQSPPRELPKRIASARDALASRGGRRVKRDADEERHALAQSEQEAADERCQRRKRSATLNERPLSLRREGALIELKAASEDGPNG